MFWIPLTKVKHKYKSDERKVKQFLLNKASKPLQKITIPVF